MKPHLACILSVSLLGCASASTGAAQGLHGRLAPSQPPGPAPSTATYKSVSGTISQFNYDPDAEVEGFLLSNHTLVHLPARAAAHIASSIHTGDNVEIGGLAQSSPDGMQTMEAQSVQDKSSGKTFTVPQPGAPAPYSGSGRIQQLNYAPNGSVNGFVFDNGTLARVAPFGASNPSSIRVGANATYSGYAHNTLSSRTVVDLQTLTINGQALNVGMVQPNPPGAGPRARPLVPPPPAAMNPAGPRPAMNPASPPLGPGAAVPPPAPANSTSPNSTSPNPASPNPASPNPAGRTEQPPAPPAPPQSPGL